MRIGRQGAGWVGCGKKSRGCPEKWEDTGVGKEGAENRERERVLLD